MIALRGLRTESVGCDAQEGLLDLRFAPGPTGRTELVARRQRFPLHLTAPLYLDEGWREMAFAYVQNPTGGVFAGDRLAMTILADVGASVHVTTTAANKIYRMEEGEARQRIEFDVRSGAYLEYMPEPLIPHAGSRYDQETVVTLAEDAALIAAETIAPGRLARGEQFGYDRLLLHTQVRVDGVDAFAETMLLEPGRRALNRRGLFGAYAYLGTLFAVAPACDAHELARVLDDRLRKVARVLGGSGVLPGEVGAFARILADSAPAAAAGVAEAWRAARQLLVGHPPPRRRK